CHLDGDFQRLARRYGGASQVLAQRLPLNKLRCDELPAGGFADVVNGQNVRVIEGGRRAGLFLEAAAGTLVTCEIAWQELQGDFAPQPGVLSQIDFAHAAYTQ